MTVSKEAYYYVDDFFMARAIADFRAASTFEEIPLQAVNSADLLFSSMSAHLTEDHTNQIKDAWIKVQDSNIINIAIRGYADNTGSETLNDSRSSARAINAKLALVSIGAPSGIIKITGFGASDAKADNSTASGRERNRRVEITFNIKAKGEDIKSVEFDKYKANDRSKMIGSPLVIAHNHIDLSYPIKALIYKNESNDPEQIIDIPNSDQIVYGLFEKENQYKVTLISKSGSMWRMDVRQD